MTTYTWLGGSANWTSPAFWTVDGNSTSTGSIRNANDSVILAGTTADTVLADSRAATAVTIQDSAATLSVVGTSGLQVGAGGLVNGGAITVAGTSQLNAGTGGLTNPGTISLDQY